MANLTQIVYLTREDYEALLADTHEPKQYTKNGKTIYYDENALYITPETITMEDLSGTLPVSKGGTGMSSFTPGQLLMGNGTNAILTKAISGSIINDANTIPTTQAVYNYDPYSVNTNYLTKSNKTFSISAANVSNMINLLDEGASDLTANDFLITQYVGGGTSNKTYYRRAASKVINATLVKAALGTDSSTTNQWLNKAGNWSTPTAANVGAIEKLSSSTDNAIVRFDGTSGAIQKSGVIIDDNNNITTPGTLKITSTSGAKYILMGNQDSGGTNRPAVIWSSNGSLFFGKGDSWSSSTGGTLTTNVYFSYDGKVRIGSGISNLPHLLNVSDGSIYVTKAGECGLEVNNTQSTNPNQVAFIVGTSGNGGIYSRKHSKWIVYSSADGTVSLNGNANTATAFSANKKVELTGDVTGSASSTGGWSIATTIGEGKVTNAMLAGSIANEKLANSSIKIGNKTISLGGTATLADIGVSYPVTSVAGKTGTVTLAKGDVGLGNVDNTADANKTVKDLTHFKVSSYTIPATKGVRIQYPVHSPVLISCQQSSSGSRLILLGGGYGEEGIVRNNFTEIVSPSSSHFTWSLPNSSSISHALEIMNLTTGDATVWVWASNSCTFTEITALTTEAMNAKLLTEQSSLAWNKLTSKPTTISGYGITDAKIASGIITLGSNTITPITNIAGETGSTVTADALRTSLGLSNAMHFLGVTTTNISTGTANTTATVTIGGSNVTAAAGDVVLYGSQEYVWGNEKWNLLGDESSYKVKQTAKSDPTASTTTSTTFIDTISQDANGVITATKKTLPTASTTVAGITKVGASGGAAAYNHNHSQLITVGDQRGTATTPNSYANTLIFQGLKNNSAIDSPSSASYAYLVGLRGWSNPSGGNAWELAFHDGGIAVRHGADTTWEAWQRIVLAAKTGVGGTTIPIYIDANGTATAGNTYAGGTAVTLNNSSKASSTASFYAPTAGGTADTQALVGNGATSAPKWVDINPSITIGAGTGSAAPTVNVTVLGQSGTAKSITTASTSVYGVTKLNDGITSNSTSLAATANSALVAAKKVASSNSASKLYLVGATSQSATGVDSYSYQYTYTNNGLLSALKLGLNLNGTEKAHLEWNNTDQSIDFIFE